jgi:CheY-like chemotaxis protein
VTDTGCGIPEDLRERIFDPFFTTKSVGKGSGLGLSMVYGFMKQSRGHITVHSLVDWGTTFRLYFPRCEPPAETAADGAGGLEALAAAPFEPEAGGGRVLLVEDDPDLRSLTATLLDSLGYGVVATADAPEALDALEHGDFDLLFSDLTLPGMSGGELARRAKAADPDLKVLYMSGYPRAEDCGAHALADGRPVLRKPFRKEELERVLREALEG